MAPMALHRYQHRETLEGMLGRDVLKLDADAGERKREESATEITPEACAVSNRGGEMRRFGWCEAQLRRTARREPSPT